VIVFCPAKPLEQQKVQRAYACRMGPFCLHRATEVEAERRTERFLASLAMTA
jgi:hypothetical protein